MLPVTCLYRHSLWCQQQQLVVKVQSHNHPRVLADRYFVFMRNIRNKTYVIHNGTYLRVSVRICAYHVRISFVLLRIAVKCYQVITYPL